MKEDDIKSVKGRWWFDRCTWLKESYESNEMIWLWYGDKEKSKKENESNKS